MVVLLLPAQGEREQLDGVPAGRLDGREAGGALGRGAWGGGGGCWCGGRQGRGLLPGRLEAVARAEAGVVLPRDLVALLVLQRVGQGVRLDVLRGEPGAAVRAAAAVVVGVSLSGVGGGGGGVGGVGVVVVVVDHHAMLLRLRARAHVLL